MNKISYLLFCSMLALVVNGCSADPKEQPKKDHTEPPAYTLDRCEEVRAEENTEFELNYLKETINGGQFIDQGYDGVEFCGTGNADVILSLWKGDTFRFVSYDRYFNKVMWESPFFSYDYFMGLCERKSRLYAICADKGKSLEIKIVDTETGREMLRMPTAKLPFFIQWEETLYFTTTEKKGKGYQDKVYQYDFSEAPTEIMAFSYEAHEDGRYTGEAITAMHGMEGFLLVQTAKTKQEGLAEGEFEIHRLQLETMEKEKYSTKQPYQFVSGDGEYVVASIHGEKRPVEESGLLFHPKENRAYRIDKVESGNDIRFAAKDGEDYWLGTTCQLMLFRSKEHDYVIAEEQEVLDDFHYREGMVSYSYGQGREKVIVVLIKNEVEYEEDIPPELRAQLSTELPLTFVELLHEDPHSVYYMESSEYRGRPYQRAEAIVWRLDKATAAIEKQGTFDFIFMPKPHTQVENGKLIVLYDDGQLEIPLAGQ